MSCPQVITNGKAYEINVANIISFCVQRLGWIPIKQKYYQSYLLHKYEQKQYLLYKEKILSF